MSQVYMTAKLNLADGTILYPQVSLDNIVASISDPTLVSVATTTDGKVPIAQLPTTLTVTDSNTTVPTAGAVYSALGTKQNTLVEGDNIIHIIGGSTIMADITNLDVAGIDQTATNGVHLVLEGNTVSAAATFVTSETAGVLAGVGDGIALDNGVISADIGSGLKIGSDADAGKVAIDEASVETTLQDVRIDGASTVSPVDDQVVTPGNLRGALSVGQAVDVSCKCGYSGVTTIEFTEDLDGNPTGDTTQYNVNSDAVTKDTSKYLGTMVLRHTYTGTRTWGVMGWIGMDFPKKAPGLRYLLLVDVKNRGTASIDSNMGYLTGLTGTEASWVDGVDHVLPAAARPGGQTTYTRLAMTFPGDAPRAYFQWYMGAGNMELEIRNWRQYEVTALTDEAIAYIAQLPDPDAFFRSNTIFQVRDKYLVKQDMVCPWIYTIPMPDNSDLTVAAGLSYKIKYTNDNPHTITADTIPADGYGWDTHIQMFIKGTSSIVFQKPLILMDALTPNAGHNLSVKWRNGDALVYVDDTNAGSIVVAATGTTAGTLNYFLQQDPGSGQDNYIIFAPATDDLTCDAGTVSVAYNTDILGNGTDKTTIAGNISVSSNKTLNLQDLAVSGGTISSTSIVDFINVSMSDVSLVGYNKNLNGVEIPEGSTVTLFPYDNQDYTVTPFSVSGSGVLDMNNTYFLGRAGTQSYAISGVTITHGKNGNSLLSPAVEDATSIKLTNVTLIGNSGTFGLFNLRGNPCEMEIRGCTVYNNRGQYYGGLGTVSKGATLNVYDSYFIQNGIGSADPLPDVGALLRVEGSGRASFYNCDLHATFTFGSRTGDTNSQYLKFVDCQNLFAITGNDTLTPTLVFGGTVGFKGYVNNGQKTKIYIEPNTVIDMTGSTIPDSSSIFETEYGVIIGVEGGTPSGSASWITADGTTQSISGCRFGVLKKTGMIRAYEASSEIVAGAMNQWDAENVIFGSPLDATAANTIKLTGTTFTSASQVLNANRIQLPAATTVSFQGNTNAADTKILEAPVILVGDDAAAPSGSVTVVNAAGTASTVSGIGTYIDKEGDNDFVALSNVSTVSTSATSGAGSLPAALTGSNKFVRIADNTVGTVGEVTEAVDKTIMTNDYEPILGGTFSLTSATVNEATKTVAIQSGGTMSVVNIRGGKESVVDLGGTGINVTSGSSVTINGVAIQNGSGLNSPVLNRGTLYMSGATVYGGDIDSANGMARCIATYGYSDLPAYTKLSSCQIVPNSQFNMPQSVLYINRGVIEFDGDCDVGASGRIVMQASCSMIVSGSNSIKENVLTYGSGGSITLTSGATLDLTGNMNSTPIAPGGGVTFAPGGATVYPSAGSASAYVLGGVTVPQIGNTNVVNLNGKNIYATESTYASGCTITGGTASAGTVGGGAFVVTSNRYLQLDDCVVSGNSAVQAGGMIVISGGTSHLSNTIISGNTAGQGADIAVHSSGEVYLNGCTVGQAAAAGNGILHFEGTNTIDRYGQYYTGSGFAIISSGAILDLTGNTNATPIAPGGGITFAQGGATILYGDSAGTPTSSATIAGGTVTILGNDASIVNTSTNRVLLGTATVTGMTFKGTNSFNVAGDYKLSNCVGSQTFGFSNSTGIVRLAGTYSAVVQTAVTGVGTLELLDGATVTMTNAEAKLAAAVGSVVVGAGCSINGNALASGTYTSCTITADGTITEA